MFICIPTYWIPININLICIPVPIAPTGFNNYSHFETYNVFYSTHNVYVRLRSGLQCTVTNLKCTYIYPRNDQLNRVQLSW